MTCYKLLYLVPKASYDAYMDKASELDKNKAEELNKEICNNISKEVSQDISFGPQYKLSESDSSPPPPTSKSKQTPKKSATKKRQLALEDVFGNTPPSLIKSPRRSSQRNKDEPLPTILSGDKTNDSSSAAPSTSTPMPSKSKPPIIDSSTKILQTPTNPAINTKTFTLGIDRRYHPHESYTAEKARAIMNYGINKAKEADKTKKVKSTKVLATKLKPLQKKNREKLLKLLNNIKTTCNQDLMDSFIDQSSSNYKTNINDFMQTLDSATQHLKLLTKKTKEKKKKQTTSAKKVSNAPTKKKRNKNENKDLVNVSIINDDSSTDKITPLKSRSSKSLIKNRKKTPYVKRKKSDNDSYSWN